MASLGAAAATSAIATVTFAPVPVTRNSLPSFALLVGPGKNLLVVTYISERSSPAKPTAVMQLHSGMSTRVRSVALLSPMSHCVLCSRFL